MDDLEGTGYTPRGVEDITALLTAPPDEVTDLERVSLIRLSVDWTCLSA
ncbi:hypothetical protein [Streptomyces hydrogenans]